MTTAGHKPGRGPHLGSPPWDNQNHCHMPLEISTGSAFRSAWKRKGSEFWAAAPRQYTFAAPSDWSTTDPQSGSKPVWSCFRASPTSPCSYSNFIRQDSCQGTTCFTSGPPLPASLFTLTDVWSVTYRAFVRSPSRSASGVIPVAFEKLPCGLC